MTNHIQFTLAELAKQLDAELHGDPNCIIRGIASLLHAKAGDISFLSSAAYHADLFKTQASAVVLTADKLKDCPCNALICSDPTLIHAKLSQLFNKVSKPKSGIHPAANIAASAKIDASASIGACSVIGERVVIGANTVIEAGSVVGDDVGIGESTHIHSNVSIGERVKIGSRVIIHSGSVLGADGFGFAHNKDRSWLKVHQLGSVIVGNDVEIGANTCVDRGALEDTCIEDGVKLDNLIQVAHNVRIGAHTVIAGCTAIAGSVNIGRYCMIGGSSTINGHISICDGAIITGTSTILKSITEPGIYMSGFPAQPSHVWKKLLIRFLQLDKIMERLKALEKGE